MNMEEKRKELMALVIGIEDEEHLDSVLEVARHVAGCEESPDTRGDMEDYLANEIAECDDAEIPRIIRFVENCCKKSYQA